MIKLESLLSDIAKSKIKPIIAYHGTNNLFNKFDLDMSTQGILWFTSNKNDIADWNTGGQGNKYTMTVELRFKNPANWDLYDKYGIEELKRSGYDSVILDSTENEHFNYIAFSPNQVKIKNIEKTKL